MASPRNKPSRRGATSQRKPARRSGDGWRIPGWLWGVAGVAAGFFLAQHQHGTAPWQEQSSTPQATVLPKPSSDERGDAQGTGQAASAEPAMPTFEFYTLLPETEVIAPGGAIPANITRPEIAEAATEAASNAAAADDASPGSTGSSANDPIAQVIAANTRPNEQAAVAATQPPAASSTSTSTSSSASTPNRYMLQAASFRDLSDAELAEVRRLLTRNGSREFVTGLMHEHLRLAQAHITALGLPTELPSIITDSLTLMLDDSEAA